jgi:alpha-tubulin suppressor-like RCC1 family protein
MACRRRCSHGDDTIPQARYEARDHKQRDHLDHRAPCMGTYHDCLINTAGAMYRWGQNAFGSLARPSSFSLSTTPIPIDLGTFANVGAITANQYTTCAWTYSPLEGDDPVQAYCWGMGHAGQLGNAAFASTHLPQRVLNLGGTSQVPGGGDQ